MFDDAICIFSDIWKQHRASKFINVLITNTPRGKQSLLVRYQNGLWCHFSNLISVSKKREVVMCEDGYLF